MPASQCGVWPAFWAYGSDWPAGGEVDIIEGANTAHNNIISAHTTDGCSLDASSNFTGVQRNTDCYIGNDNVGCGYNPPSSDTSSYGDGFNAVGGGVYAMAWDSDEIRVWHFPRGEIPLDIITKTPSPDSWGSPQAAFGGNSCDVDNYFSDMRIVLNINFCGDYGSAIWGIEDTCDTYASTCSEYVAENPTAFANAYWEVNSIDVYTFDANADPQPTTTTVMTSLSTTTVFVNGTTSASVVVADPTATAGPANPTSIADYAYLGCFNSSSNFTTFQTVQDSDSMTLETCVDLCGNTTYAGVFER